MPIVIKRKVSFSFLGEDYKDAYLVFRSIPITDYDDLQEQARAVGTDNAKATLMLLEALKKYFVEGKFPDMDTVTKEDLDGLDAEAIIKSFSVLSGQEMNTERGEEVPQVADLKDESTTQSSTEVPGQTN